MSTPVFLVDDDRQLLRAMAQTLELADFAVTPFASAAEALSQLDRDFAGVVVSDIRMPGMDGLQLFERILGLDSEIPVILVTGHGILQWPSKPSRTAYMISSPSRFNPNG